MKQYFLANQDAEFGMLAVLKKWTELEDDNWYIYKTFSMPIYLEDRY